MLSKSELVSDLIESNKIYYYDYIIFLIHENKENFIYETKK